MRRLMKGLMGVAAIGLTLGLLAPQASALSVGDANYLGAVIPDTPADPTSEAAYINSLLAIAPGGSSSDATHDYDRTNSTLDCGACPAATEVGSFKDDTTPPTTIDVTGWQYLLAKYGQNAHVWYVGNLSGDQTIPGDLATKGSGLSHIALYNPSAVPEPGTLALVGGALLALGLLRRRP